LNYTVTLRIPEHGLLTAVTGTNALIMGRNCAALEHLLDMRVSVQGHTDLAFAPWIGRDVLIVPHSQWLKFSGNAQRRRRQALLFHGTILHDFDLRIIDELLRFPSVQPKYRENRDHGKFVGNIPARREAICAALGTAWDARETFTALPSVRIEQLCREHYENDAWTRRRAH
jgi:lipoate-protein ligase A